MKIWKWWYLIAICFVLGDNLLDSATETQIWLSLNNLQNNYGFGRCIYIKKIVSSSML